MANPYLAHISEPFQMKRKRPTVGAMNPHLGLRSYPVDKRLEGHLTSLEDKESIARVEHNGTSKKDAIDLSKTLDSRIETKHKSKHIYPHGNYPHYYSYRYQHINMAGELDARLLKFDSAWFHAKRILDVGCNSGQVTSTIAMKFKPSFILGVDIDPSLVRTAKYLLSYRFSLTNDQVDKSSEVYFPRSCIGDFGMIPLTLQMKGSCSFPYNIDFRVGDWAHEPIPYDDSERFDVILALSVTKWIHLNGGDGGIKYFFRKCAGSLLKGGRLIIEPQAFDTYLKRANISLNISKNYEKIRMVPTSFPGYIESLGMVCEHVIEHPDTIALSSAGPVAAKGFLRPIYVFRKE